MLCRLCHHPCCHHFSLLDSDQPPAPLPPNATCPFAPKCHLPPYPPHSPPPQPPPPSMRVRGSKACSTVALSLLSSASESLAVASHQPTAPPPWPKFPSLTPPPPPPLPCTPPHHACAWVQGLLHCRPVTLVTSNLLSYANKSLALASDQPTPPPPPTHTQGNISLP
jgi:hypothetical protein